jgi:hypothetical protein
MAQRFYGCTAVFEEIPQRSFRRIYGDIELPGSHVESADVVAVLVRNEYRIDPARFEPCGSHAGKQLPGAQPGIDQQATGTSFNNSTVTFASAGQNSATHCLNYLPSSY